MNLKRIHMNLEGMRLHEFEKCESNRDWEEFR